MVEGASVKLRMGSCEGEVVSTLNHDGTFEGGESYDENIEIQYYVELTHQGKIECQALEKSWVHLATPTLSLDEEQTALDKASPKFNVTNLFPGKEVTVTLHTSSDCSDESVSSSVVSSTGSVNVSLSSPLSKVGTYSYYVKQSYQEQSTCSQVLKYIGVKRLETVMLLVQLGSYKPYHFR